MSLAESSLDKILEPQENASERGLRSTNKVEEQTTKNQSASMLKDIKNLYLHIYGYEFDRGSPFSDSDSEVENIVHIPQIKTNSASRVPKCHRVHQLPTTIRYHSNKLTIVPTRDESQYSSSNESDTEESELDEGWLFETHLPHKPEPKLILPRSPSEAKVTTAASVKKSKPGPGLCHYCGKLLDKKSFNYHLQTHEKGYHPQLRCRGCYKKFLTAELRDEHMKIHDFTKKYIPCKQCSEMFDTMRRLHKHVHRIHKGLKYVCEFCSKKFISNGKMQKHISSMHGGPKNYVCQFCGKGYSQNCTLQYHVRSHSDNTSPYTCGYCETSYTYKYTMLNHIKNKHAGDGKNNAKCCVKCLVGFFAIDFEDHECKIDE